MPGEIKITRHQAKDGYQSRVCVPGGGPGYIALTIDLAEDFACGFELTSQEARDLSELLRREAERAGDI